MPILIGLIYYKEYNIFMNKLEKKFREDLAGFRKAGMEFQNSTNVWELIENDENAHLANLVGEFSGYQAAIDRVVDAIDWNKKEHIESLHYKMVHVTLLIGGKIGGKGAVNGDVAIVPVWEKIKKTYY